MAADPDKVAPWFFPSIAEYRRLLEQGVFAVRAIMLVPRPTELDIGIRGWLETFGRSFFEQFEEPQRGGGILRGHRASAPGALRC
jgi:hypothetical protein